MTDEMTDLLAGQLIAESLTKKKHPNRRQTSGTTTLKQSQLISRPPFSPEKSKFSMKKLKFFISRKILNKKFTKIFSSNPWDVS
jgi:hypothetical protein